MTERLYLYDTTLRDGAQTRGVDFSVRDKQTVAGWLDDLGIAYIEGGWPGANPTDTAFFASPPAFKNSTFTAFGMTRRPQAAAHKDGGLQKVLGAGTPAVCLVGKTWDFQVTKALGITLEENLEIIRSSVAEGVAKGKEVILDAEHFFDGFKADPGYATACLQVALEAGARWIVLCDTNGGTLPHEVAAIVRDVAHKLPHEKLGIHAHNDIGLAAANSLTAVREGCRMVQGTLAGLGERCGNADLLTLIPTFMTKMGYDVGIGTKKLAELTALAHAFDRLLDRPPNPNAPYIGEAAFAHKGGLHASAVAKRPCLYEHIDPSSVGNAREVLMSNQAGQANVRAKLEALNIGVEPDDPRLPALLEAVKKREQGGYAYDNAAGSFAVLALRKLKRLNAPFVLQSFSVNNQGVLSHDGKCHICVQAQVRVKIGDIETQAMADGNGPVHALDNALRKALMEHFPDLAAVRLTDYRVRILDTGTATGAITRVLLESEDDTTRTKWTTVGVSTNIIGASLEALLDAYAFGLVKHH